MFDPTSGSSSLASGVGGSTKRVPSLREASSGERPMGIWGRDVGEGILFADYARNSSRKRRPMQGEVEEGTTGAKEVRLD